MSVPLMSADRVEVRYGAGGLWTRRAGSVVHAVDGVSLTLAPGEVLALVGESGCGKSSLARALAGLRAPDGGTVQFAGRDIGALRGADHAAFRRAVQMVFQDPFDSLNPRRTVFDTLAQPLRIHDVVPRRMRRLEAARLLDLVGLSPGAGYLDRYPHQFSGGQRQRVCIARAIATRPLVLIADEPVSALDVSIRAQILNLFQRLTRDLDLAAVFITHDLGVVRSLCDRVAVMYLGRIVEEGPTEQVFQAPAHPYTAALLAASPIPDPAASRRRRHVLIEGDVPSPRTPPAGCRFHTRCAWRQARCHEEVPLLQQVAAGHASACHFVASANLWQSTLIEEMQE
jgi:oligopeptide/dipeptide ABC transporter ATP-binding protein